ncbi:biosynthetic peptidoglycan transglycosylase [Mycolicibacterium madagascariense]|uniref:biosynthetic peptidoglycan transglycosylase n=1 Tax=Mycolicibacterium madagascariense TaxID=212765 RepID=UPI0013D4CBC6|nr:biosynthetic peptidoglycan transglycosylase [Mycolicibacterium madagascariense]MCV7015101.1 transglycosylase domain-containing protein [Mycolicibacterium madagascariense]
MSRASDEICDLYIRHAAGVYADRLNLPTHFVHLLLLIEDKRFGLHIGIDPVSMIRAAANNISGGPLQGASTITQQLYDIMEARSQNQYSRDRTITRKISQLRWALLIERHKRKSQILSDYLAYVYWGRNYFGVEAASNGYFGSSSRSLSVAESFFLAERLASPNRLLPARVEELLSRPCVKHVMSMDANSEIQVRRMYSSWS